MTASPYSCVLWDVDGTIADASRGMFARLTQVLEAFERPAQTPAELRRWMGPPLVESFTRFAGLDPADAARAVAMYRGLPSEGGYAAGIDLYPGVPEIVRAVRAAGIPQSTASTKPESQVRQILDHYGLLPEFTALSGARGWPEGMLDGKAFVVGRALERLEAAGADVSRPVLVGDRHHDVDGGGEHGVPVIFVDWGFGEPDEAAGSIHRAATPTELRKLLLSAGNTGAGNNGSETHSTE